MVSAADDRRRNAYEEATTLSQAMLDETFRGGENQIEAVAILTKTVGATTYTLRFADRPKYVGDDFYEGRARFPQVKRTMGDPQAPTIQFSQFEVELSNLDGFYNAYLEGGASYFSFIGARLQVQIGLRDVSGSFITVFDGFVPEEDGFGIERESIIIRATDKFNDLNRRSPLPYIDLVDFPSAPADSVGKIIPLVLGDWEAGYNMTSSAGAVSIQDAGTAYDVRTDSPSGFYGGTIGYNVGGGFFVFSIGDYTPDNISDVHVKRGDAFMKANFDATPDNTAGYWSAEVTSLVKVGGGSVPYVYQSGDLAVIKVKVPYSAGAYNNIIYIAEQVLYTLGGKSSGDLDTASWDAFKAKATPAQSAFTAIKGRIWIGEEKDSVLGIVLGLLEQVRLEMFVNSAGLISLTSLQPEDFPAPASAAARIEQIELNEESVRVKADERLFLNQAWVNYAFTPVSKKTELTTVQKLNQTSIDKSGKRVIKTIDCPNLYVEADAENQLVEFLRLYSAGLSFVECEVAWVHLLRDLGEFISFNYSVGSLDYSAKPMQIREVTVNLGTGAVTLKLLSFANFSYTGYAPSNASRFLSGAAQSITDA